MKKIFLLIIILFCIIVNKLDSKYIFTKLILKPFDDINISTDSNSLSIISYFENDSLKYYKLIKDQNNNITFDSLYFDSKIKTILNNKPFYRINGYTKSGLFEYFLIKNYLIKVGNNKIIDSLKFDDYYYNIMHNNSYIILNMSINHSYKNDKSDFYSLLIDKSNFKIVDTIYHSYKTMIYSIFKPFNLFATTNNYLFSIDPTTGIIERYNFQNQKKEIINTQFVDAHNLYYNYYDSLIKNNVNQAKNLIKILYENQFLKLERIRNIIAVDDTTLIVSSSFEDTLSRFNIIHYEFKLKSNKFYISRKKNVYLDINSTLNLNNDQLCIYNTDIKFINGKYYKTAKLPSENLLLNYKGNLNEYKKIIDNYLLDYDLNLGIYEFEPFEEDSK